MTLSSVKAAIATDLSTVAPTSAAKVLIGKDFLARQETDADGDYSARVILVPTSFRHERIIKTTQRAASHVWKRAVYTRYQTIEIHCWAKSTNAELAGDAKKEADLFAVSELVDRVSVAMRRYGTDESAEPGSGDIGQGIKTNEYGASAVFSMTVLWPVFDAPIETVAATPGTIAGSYS